MELRLIVSLLMYQICNNDNVCSPSVLVVLLAFNVPQGMFDIDNPTK